MHRPWRVFVGLVVVGSLLGMAPASAPAQEEKSPEQLSYATGAATKFGRGFVNLVSGWTELGVQTWRGAEAQGPAGAAIGFGRGIVMVVLRTLAGAYEVATFPVPLPENWQPPITPGFGLPGYELAGTPGP